MTQGIYWNKWKTIVGIMVGVWTMCSAVVGAAITIGVQRADVGNLLVDVDTIKSWQTSADKSINIGNVQLVELNRRMERIENLLEKGIRLRVEGVE